MVKKLIKHEFIYYARTFSIAFPIVLVMAIMTRVFMGFAANDNIVTNIIASSSIIMLVLACAAAAILSVAISVIRFYKNMYSQEGYLTFTLPVNNHQHILVKLAMATACQLFAVITVILSIIIVSWDKDGGFLLIRELAKLLKTFSEVYGRGNVAILTIEIIVFLIVSIVFSTLLYYTCITIGQTAKKNRIAMAVVTYLIYYGITQVNGTIFSIFFISFSSTDAFWNMSRWMTENPVTTLHICMCGGILLYTALSTAFYVITHRVMTKKLNLE